MGAVVFDNIVFDSWLNKKSDEILSKVDREKITTEEMIILLLKAQTNHFHHMDDEFRGEFRGVYKHFDRMGKQFREVDRRFEQVDKRFAQVDKRFEQIDQRFDRLTKILMWYGGIMITLFSGLYLKLIF